MYEQYGAFEGEGKQSTNISIFMLLLLGFPLKMSADIKAAGTDDEDLRGPVCLNTYCTYSIHSSNLELSVLW